MKCHVCDKNISTPGNLNKHLRVVHKAAVETKCKCGRYFNNHQSLNAHYRWCIIHRNGVLPPPSPNKNKPSPLKGKTLEQFSSNAELTRKKLSLSRIGKGFPHSVESKKKLSEARIRYLENCHHVKWYNVNGVKVQGTWEKQVAEKLLELGIKFSRRSIKYDSYRTYTPDFYLDDLDVYLEVKGWLSERDKNKYARVINEHKFIRILLLRDELGIGNFSKFINGEIGITQFEELSRALGT